MPDSATLTKLRKNLEDLEKQRDDPKTGIDVLLKAALDEADGDPASPKVQALAQRREKLNDDLRQATTAVYNAEVAESKDAAAKVDSDARKATALEYLKGRGGTPAKDADEYARDLEAMENAGIITHDQGNQRWKAFEQKTVDQPAKDKQDARQAEIDRQNKENTAADNARADAQLVNSGKQLSLSEQANTRAANAADRAVANDERRFSLDQRKYAQDVGKTAVERAMTGDNYARRHAFAQATGAGRSAGDSLSAAYAGPAPNFDDIADRAIARALADIIPPTAPAQAAAPAPQPNAAPPDPRASPGPAPAPTAGGSPGTITSGPSNYPDEDRVNGAMGRYSRPAA